MGMNKYVAQLQEDTGASAVAIVGVGEGGTMNKFVAQLYQDTGASPEAIVEAGGGGGTSDFTIANVTITKIGLIDDTALIGGIPIVVSGEDSGALTVKDTFKKSDGEETLLVPMYKGVATFEVWGYTFTTTGDVSYNSGAVIVTGDGTLNIAGTDK